MPETRLPGMPFALFGQGVFFGCSELMISSFPVVVFSTNDMLLLLMRSQPASRHRRLSAGGLTRYILYTRTALPIASIVPRASVGLSTILHSNDRCLI